MSSAAVKTLSYALLCSTVIRRMESLNSSDFNAIYEVTNNSVSWLTSVSNSLHGRFDYYDINSLLATRIQIWKNSAFLVTPRFCRKSPFTLSRTYLGGRSGPASSALFPFPDWTMNEGVTKNSVRNAVDTFIDSKGILWVLDIGLPENTIHQTSAGDDPKILSYDLRNGQVLNSIPLRNLTCINSRLRNIFVEYTDKGRNCFVYVTDSLASGAIIIWNVRSNKGHRSVLPPAIKGFYEPEDILFATLLTFTDELTSKLYFTYLHSDRFFAVKTDFLREKVENNAIENKGNKKEAYILLGSDNRSTVFVRRMANERVYKWNVTATDTFRTESLKILYKSNPKYLCSQIVIDNGRPPTNLWSLENDLQYGFHKRNQSIIARFICLNNL